MRIPRIPTRPLIAAAAVLAAAVILTTDIDQTHATEPVNPQVAENSHGGTTIGTPMSATSTAGTVSYSLTGTDAASFAINPTNGEIRLAADVSPDFEAKSAYELNVVASTTVTIEVMNVNEPGIVNLSPQAPGVGDTVTATLTDPDCGIANAAWTWSRSDADAWNTMAGTTQASYTTGADDIGHRIRAEVSYDDAAGTSQQANAATDAVKNDPAAGTAPKPNQSGGYSAPQDYAPPRGGRNRNRIGCRRSLRTRQVTTGPGWTPSQSPDPPAPQKPELDRPCTTPLPDENYGPTTTTVPNLPGMDHRPADETKPNWTPSQPPDPPATEYVLSREDKNWLQNKEQELSAPPDEGYGLGYTANNSPAGTSVHTPHSSRSGSRPSL